MGGETVETCMSGGTASGLAQTGEAGLKLWADIPVDEDIARTETVSMRNIEVLLKSILPVGGE